ncbi:MAG: hypothetical protein ACKPKO_26800, partial [Candidatus Fonsibacter sp.]
MDITVKKLYGLLSSKSNSQRAFLQMVNRSQCVSEARMGLLSGEGLSINSNSNCREHAEGLE